MKKIKTTDIVENVAKLPFQKASLEHLQESYQEVIEDILKGLVDESTDPIALFGCVDSDVSATAWDISAGVIFFGGEVYKVDAFIGTDVTDVPVLSLVTTYNAVDPVTFSDNNPHSVHEIRKLEWSMGVSGSGLADFGDVSAFKDLIKPNSINAGGETIKTKIVEIGDWDMNTTPLLAVNHGISSGADKIKSVFAVIYTDGTSVATGGGISMTRFNISIKDGTTGEPAGGIKGWNNTQIELYADAGGLFGLNASFNSTPFNRGTLYIEYTP